MFRLFLTGLLLGLVSGASPKKVMDYNNSNLSVEQRVADLMGRMTLEEKVGQMCQYVGIAHMLNAQKTLTEEDVLRMASIED